MKNVHGNNLLRQSVLLGGILCLAVSCGGAAGGIAATENSTQQQDVGEISNGNETGSLTNSGSAMPRAAAITINLSHARAMLVQDGETEVAATDGLAETNTVMTNFWILDSDGVLQPAITLDGTDEQTRRIEIERIDVAPTGETYLLFAHTVSINGERCKWVVVNAEKSDEAKCADTDTRYEFAQIKFAPDGDVYYSSRQGQIKTRDHNSGQVRTLFTGAEINFTIETFFPAPDGSIITNGTLVGTGQEFFRLYPEANGDVALEEQCLESVRAKQKGSEPGNEMFLSSSGDLYVERTGRVCADLNWADLYRGTFGEDGEISFTTIPGVDGDFFAEDSAGDVYSVTTGDDDDAASITRVSRLPYERMAIPLMSVASLKVVGDNVFATGRDESGDYIFLRKNLVTGTEEDLLDGLGMVVQEFQVEDTGDVYFAAVDYTDATRKLFRYADATGALEVVAALPESLKEIVFIARDGSDQFGLPAE